MGCLTTTTLLYISLQNSTIWLFVAETSHFQSQCGFSDLLQQCLRGLETFLSSDNHTVCTRQDNSCSLVKTGLKSSMRERDNSQKEGGRKPGGGVEGYKRRNDLFVHSVITLYPHKKNDTLHLEECCTHDFLAENTDL